MRKKFKNSLQSISLGLFLLSLTTCATFFDSFIGNRIGLNAPFEDTATIVGEDEIMQPNSVDKVLVEVSSPTQSEGQLMDVVHCYSFRNGLFGKATQAIVFWTRISFQNPDYWRDGHSHHLSDISLPIRATVNQIGVFENTLNTLLLSQGTDYFQLYLDLIPGPFQPKIQAESEEKVPAKPLRYQYWPTEKLFLSLDNLFLVSESKKAFFSCTKYLGVIDFSFVTFEQSSDSNSDSGPPALQLYTLFNGALAKEVGPLGRTETITMLGLRPSFSTMTSQQIPTWNNKLFLLLENRAGDSAQLRIEEVDADQIVRSAQNVAIFNNNGATFDAQFAPIEIPNEKTLTQTDQYIFGACGYLSEPYQIYTISLVINQKDEQKDGWLVDRRKELSVDSDILTNENEYAECMGLVRRQESTPQNPQIDVIYTTESRILKVSIHFKNDAQQKSIELISAKVQKSIQFPMSSQGRTAAFLQPWSPTTITFPEMYLIAARSPSETLSSFVNDGFLFSEYYLRKASPKFYQESPRKITQHIEVIEDLESLKIDRSKIVYPPANVRYYYFQAIVSDRQDNKSTSDALSMGYQWIQTGTECAKLLENDYSGVENRGIQDGWTTVYNTISNSDPMKVIKDERTMSVDNEDRGFVIDNNLFWYKNLFNSRVQEDNFWGQALISLCFNETETFQTCNDQREPSGEEFDYKQAVQVKEPKYYGTAFLLPSDPSIRCFFSAIKMTRIDGFTQLNLENQAKRIKVVEIGEKPYLDPPPPTTFSVMATFDASFPIGEAKDPEGNRVVMSVWLRQASKFALFDETTRRVNIQGTMTGERDVGVYPITIKLAEIVDGAQINAQIYQITLNMLAPPIVPEPEPRIVPPGTVMTIIRGQELRNDGKFTFMISKPIQFPSDLKEKINEALVTEPIPLFNVGEIDPLQKYREMIQIEAIAGFYSEKENMGLTYEVIDIQPKYIEVQLKFEKGFEISQNQEPDSVVAKFRVQEYGDISVEEEYTVVRPLPRQIPSAAQAAAIEGAGASSEVASTAIMGGNFIISLILAASLNQLWALMNGLQLAVHLPIFNTVFPANANFFISFLISVATFDILPGFIIPLIFDFPEREPYSLGLMTCGYGSRYSIGNLGTCFFLIILMIFQAITCFILSFFKDRYAFAKRHYEKLRSTLFWNVFLRFFFEGYLELSFSVFVSLVDLTWQDINYSVGFNNVFSLFVGAILLGLPFFIFFYYGSQLDNFDDEEFIEKFGDLYEGMQMQPKAGERWIALFYPFFFVVRRLLFALVGLFVQKQLIFQLMVVFACTVIQLVYLGWYRPFEDQRLVNLEIMNECTSLILLYHLMLFTDFVPEAETRYHIGWSFIFFVVANMAVHFTILIKDTIADIKENGCCKKEEEEQDEKDKEKEESFREEKSNDSKFDMLQADPPVESKTETGQKQGPDYESFSDWDEDKLGKEEAQYKLEAITWKDLGQKFIYHVKGIVKPPKKPRVIKKRLNHVHVAQATQADQVGQDVSQIDDSAVLNNPNAMTERGGNSPSQLQFQSDPTLNPNQENVDQGNQGKLLSPRLVDFKESSGEYDDDDESSEGDISDLREGEPAQDEVQNEIVQESPEKQSQNAEELSDQESQNEEIQAEEGQDIEVKKQKIIQDENISAIENQLIQSDEKVQIYENDDNQQDINNKAHLQLLKGALQVNKQAEKAQQNNPVESNSVQEVSVKAESNPEPQFPIDGAPPSDFNQSELNQPIENQESIVNNEEKHIEEQ